jgi:radical SAM protein with 4Fe4S-binding SPASM domain
MLTNIALRPLRKSGKVIGLPAHLQVEITNKCNLKCLSCHRDLLYPNTTSMSFEDFKKVYDDIQPSRINVSGLGEPFLNPDVFKIIRYAKQAGSSVNCATNFTVVGNKLDKLIESGIDQVKISIDAANRETFLKIRKKNLHDVVVENIIRLDKIKGEQGLKKPEVRFNFALQKENIDELFDTIELAKSLNVKSIYIQYLVYIDREGRKTKLVGDMTSGKIKSVLVKADKMSKSYGIRTNIDMWMREFRLFWNNMQPIEKFAPNKKYCYFPWFSSWIDADGTVRPCPIIPWKRGVALMGNSFKDNFTTIWNNKAYIEFRKAHAKGKRPNEVCETCIPPSLTTIFKIGTKLLPGNK